MEIYKLKFLYKMDDPIKTPTLSDGSKDYFENGIERRPIIFHIGQQYLKDMEQRDSLYGTFKDDMCCVCNQENCRIRVQGKVSKQH